MIAPRSSRRTLGEWMAIVGTVLTTAMILFVALGLAAVARGLMGDSSASLESLLIPTLVAGTGCAIVVIGLLQRSRVAYAVAALIGAFTLYVWIDLMLGSSTSPFAPIPLLIVLPPTMILIGLALSWREFWRRDARD